MNFNDGHCGRQTELDLETLRVASVPKWTRYGLLDHIMELIVQYDAVSQNTHGVLVELMAMLFQAFLLVECPSFRRLLTYQRPQTSERDIPHHTLVRQELMAKAVRVADATTTRLAVRHPKRY